MILVIYIHDLFSFSYIEKEEEMNSGVGGYIPYYPPTY